MAVAEADGLAAGLVVAVGDEETAELGVSDGKVELEALVVGEGVADAAADDEGDGVGVGGCVWPGQPARIAIEREPARAAATWDLRVNAMSVRSSCVSSVDRS